MNDLVRSNVHCTNCGRDFGAEFDLAVEGNLTIVCPHCGHEHYRRVEAGEVTERRWASSGVVNTQYASTSTQTFTVTFDSTTSYTTTFTGALWTNLAANT